MPSVRAIRLAEGRSHSQDRIAPERVHLKLLVAVRPSACPPEAADQRLPKARRPGASSAGWIEFLCENNFWDAHAGRELPNVNIFTGASVDVWQTLGDDLTQSNWAVSTRRLYQGWLRAYLLFCDWCSSPALPVVPIVLRDWLTRVAANYASGTVQIAASAVIGFCALNNFANPLTANPICKLVVDAAKKIKCGESKKQRAALDAQFLLDVWEVIADLKRSGHFSLKNRRARCVMQLAFEAALRGGEISNLKVCDLAFVACGPACGHACKEHRDSDAYVFARLHKTSVQGSVKVIRLVAPETPTMVGGESVSAIHCLITDWLPFLRSQGLHRHRLCRTSFSSKFRCDLCPSLFPTFRAPSKSDGVSRAISVSAITEMYKKFAVMTRRDPTGYASHSGRIGSFSDATAAGEDTQVAAKSLGWASDRVPNKVYKRKTQTEARATGVALASSIASAAQERSGCKEAVPGALDRPAGPVQRPVASVPPANTVRPSKVVTSKGPAVPDRSPQDKPVDPKVKPFPLKWKSVDGQEVCVRYQLGICRKVPCPHAHVCHACGRRHPDGRLCRSAIRAVSGWKPT